MSDRRWSIACLFAAAAALCVTWAPGAETPAGSSGRNDSEAAGQQPAADEHRVSVDVARDRAKVMHDVYAATLESMHHHYFRTDKATVPARALQDVFDEIARNSKIEARWISVTTKPMSIDHEPETDFEKKAARTISDGTTDYEVIEDGVYRRAGASPLGAGCVSCHVGFFKPTSKKEHFAGLVISIPVKKD